MNAVDGGILPADIARGPDPAVWATRRAWWAAGERWSRENLGAPTGWRALLPPDVAYATSALGRSHARHGDYRPPWIRKSKPKENQ